MQLRRRRAGSTVEPPRRIGRQSGGDQTPSCGTRVATVIKGLGVGGAERIVADMVPELNRLQSHYVEVLSTHPAADYADEVRAAGIKVNFPPSRVPWSFWLLWQLRPGRFDVVHCHSPLPAILIAVLKSSRLSRFEFVYTAHREHGSFHVLTRIGLRCVYSRMDHIIAVSDSARVGGPSEQVVFHGVPRIARRAENFAVAGKSPRLVMVANFRPEKAHSVLLEAVSILKADGVITPRLDLIGDGETRFEIERAIEALGITDNVTLLGSLIDVRERLQDYDIAILSSLVEGFPISLVEALAAGLSIVATDLPGTRQVLTTEAGEVVGELVEPGSAAALAEGIERLATSSDWRLSRERISTRARELGLDAALSAYSRAYSHSFVSNG